MLVAIAVFCALLAACSGLVLSMGFYDKGVPHYLSRKVGHIFGGFGYLFLVLSENFWVALIVASGAALGMVALRRWKPDWLRGVGGTGRSHTYAELSYPIAAVVSLVVGWGIMGDRWMALLPILLMAWGDAITGLVRTLVYHREVKGNWGTVGFVAVGLACALLYQPYWIGAVAVAAGGLVERLAPLAHGLWEDNWMIVAASLTTIIFLEAVF